MKIETKQEISEILAMPEDEFFKTVAPAAKQKSEEIFNKTIRASAMVGYTNICKNQCLYCGMRAGNSTVPRFRIPPEDVISLCKDASKLGYRRVFLVAGEDPKYGFDNLVKIVSELAKSGMTISLACGEFEKSQFEELLAAGADTYTLKFEMSDPVSFNRMNPSTNFNKRMKAIETVKSLGMKLASGNIIDWPGQTAEELTNDIYLMKQLDICWAPVIPYAPAQNTPLAENGKPGSLLKLYKEIAILRLMMPKIDITAQQPGKDLRKGLSDPEANLAAVNAGANVLFFDLLPAAKAQSFRVIDNRNITEPSHIIKVAELSGYSVDTGEILQHN